MKNEDFRKDRGDGKTNIKMGEFEKLKTGIISFALKFIKSLGCCTILIS